MFYSPRRLLAISACLVSTVPRNDLLTALRVAKPGAKPIDDCRADLITRYWMTVRAPKFEEVKLLADKLLLEHKGRLSVLCHSMACAAEVEENRVTAVLIANKDRLVQIESALRDPGRGRRSRRGPSPTNSPGARSRSGSGAWRRFAVVIVALAGSGPARQRPPLRHGRMEFAACRRSSSLASGRRLCARRQGGWQPSRRRSHAGVGGRGAEAPFRLPPEQPQLQAGGPIQPQLVLLLLLLEPLRGPRKPLPVRTLPARAVVDQGQE